MNDTILKFGYPTTLLRAYERWVVLLRPAQVTLGSLVVACTEPATAFSAITAEAFAELPQVIRDVERALADRVGYEKINWLMLMMVDREVHFHVLPRYAGARSFGGQEFADAGWPRQPDLAGGRNLSAEEIRALAEHLRPCF